MKKILLLLLVAISLAAYSQKADLSNVNTVRPKKGQKMAFEASWKAHVAKFHKADNATGVYEILSGDNLGYYHIVRGSMSYASLDSVRSDAAAHSADLDKTFFPYLEDKSMNGVYRFSDSLSFHASVQADKYVVNVRHIKLSLEADYRREIARSAKTLAKMQGAFWDNLSLNVFEQLWDGTDPVFVTIRNLKDGFKALETDFYGAAAPGAPTFRDVYSKEYGTADWDKRVKLLDEAVVKNEQYIMRLRKDLSTQ